MIKILDIIKTINLSKREKGISPTSATFDEVLTEVNNKLKEEINKCVKNGTVRFHKTLNSLSFDAINQDDN